MFAIVKASHEPIFGLALLGVSSMAGSIGAILFAIVMVWDGRLPRWTGVLFGLSGFLPALSGPSFFATELMGKALLLISRGMDCLEKMARIRA